ncbi:MAG: hypothetical protein EA361_17875 [Bacteroidetes bacterium]|nr:MAG: hypothetical protein EA361_17875 [Bacteroidota bacterium]
MKTLQSIQWLSLAMMFLLPVMVAGQPGMGQRQEQYRQMEAKRIAFITRELSLTPEEAQVFWPVYNEYNQKRNQMMIRHREERKVTADIDKLSESELMDLADEDIRNMEDMVALRREYHERFKQILPVKKVILLYNAERDFNRKLYHEGRGRQDSPGRRRN